MSQADSENVTRESKRSAISVRVSIGGDNWFQVPTRQDTLWLASEKLLPWYEAKWLPYLTTVRDLLSAGF